MLRSLSQLNPESWILNPPLSQFLPLIDTHQALSAGRG